MTTQGDDGSREQQSGASRENGDVKGDNNVQVNVPEMREVQFTGYRSSVFGEIGYALACFMSLLWIALFLLILVDTYNACEVQGVDDLCFYGNNFILAPTASTERCVRANILFLFFQTKENLQPNFLIALSS